MVSVPAAWTDVVPEDPVVQMGAGRSPCRVQDLAELAVLIERLQRERDSTLSVKEITS